MSVKSPDIAFRHPDSRELKQQHQVFLHFFDDSMYWSIECICNMLQGEENRAGFRQFFGSFSAVFSQDLGSF
jgi:hypothetical protein